MSKELRDEAVCDVGITFMEFPSLGPGHPDRYSLFDIFDVRRARTGFGLLELKQFVWIRMQSWDIDALSELTGSIYVVPQPRFQPAPVVDVEIAIKARFCVPPEVFEREMPGFDVELARDPGVIYQPFFGLEEFSRHDRTAYRIVDSLNPISPDGNVFDKQTGEFIYEEGG